MVYTAELEEIVPASVEPVADRPRRSWWTIIALAVCVLIGSLSVLTRSWLPSYDVFSWLVWGRELAHHVIGPHEPFDTRGGSSWKPFPVIFTTIFGFFGDAPKLWAAFARSLGLIGLVLAFRVGARFTERLGGDDQPSWSRPAAGVLAAFAVFLTVKWSHYMLRDTSEPIVITATLLAIDLHLHGRRVLAFWSGVALALMRPEASVFVGLYAVWLFWVTPSRWVRLMLVAGVVLIAAAWTVPTLLGGHSAFSASNQARDYNGHLGAHPIATVLKRATNLTVWPVIIAAGAATLIAIRRRDRLILTLAAAALGYVAVVAAMAVAHYPGLERFMLPAAAVASVLAGAGVVIVAGWLGGRLGAVTGNRGRVPALSGVIAVMLIAIAVPFFIGRITSQSREQPLAALATTEYDRMADLVRHAGGTSRMLPCGAASRLAINHSIQPSLAWMLHIPLSQIRPVTRRETSLKRPLLFIKAPYNLDDGGAPHLPLHDGLKAKLLDRVGRWKLFAVTRPGFTSRNECVGA